MTPLDRQGLDRLLAERPEFEVMRYEVSDVWISVDLAIVETGYVEQWAIWRATGNVYGLDLEGAVLDDPEFVITPFGVSEDQS